MGTRLIRLLAAASIFACALAAGMAPATMAVTEDPAGTVQQVVEDPPPIEVTGEPTVDPIVVPGPSLTEPPPIGADETTVATIDPAPTESPAPETPPADTTGTGVDPQQGLPTDVVEALPIADVPPVEPPADVPPGATAESPPADPPQVIVEGIVPEPVAAALAEPEAPALGPAVGGSSAKPATRPRSTPPAASVRTAPRTQADPPVAAAEPAETGVATARTRRPASGSDPGLDGVAAAGAGLVAGLAVTGRAQATIAVAMEFGRAGGGWAGTLVFNIWLRRQLRERRISQRQLAALSGVDHSTISRLLSQDRRPSLATATKLVGALRHIGGDEAEPAAADFFDRLPEETVFPGRRVELALRADELLDEEEVRRLMSIYLKARRGHLVTRDQPAPIDRIRPADPPGAAVERRR